QEAFNSSEGTERRRMFLRQSGPRVMAAFIFSSFVIVPRGMGQTPPDASALLTQYCVVCHDNAKRTAGITFQGLDLSRIGDNAPLLEKVLNKVKTRQMPPAGMPHPDLVRRAA